MTSSPWSEFLTQALFNLVLHILFTRAVTQAGVQVILGKLLTFLIEKNEAAPWRSFPAKFDPN